MKTSVLVIIHTLLLVAFTTPIAAQVVSDEARRHFDRGTAAVEIAKSPDDYDVAIKEFKQAIDLAPDWADAYYNLGKVQEQAEKFGDAIASFRQYLRLAPNANDAESVKSLINKLEFKAENTLSTADIISVLTSLSKWEVKGNCGSPEAYKSITLTDDGTIKLLMAWIPWKKETSYKSLKVEGPTIKYRWVRDICSPSVTGECGVIFEDEIEVLSKNRVRVRQLTVRGGAILSEREWLPIGNPGEKFECELSPPK